MPKWTVLSKTKHADKYYQPRQGFNHIADQMITPVLLAELPKLLSQNILGFIRSGDIYRLVALLGLEEGRNLYVNNDGRWLGSYVPANARSFPFALAPDPEGQLVLCIDSDQLAEAPAGQPLFDEGGQLASSLEQHMNFLKSCEEDSKRTQAAVDALQALDLLQPWPLEVPRALGQEPFRIDGLYRIDEKRLNTLEEKQYTSLQGSPMAIAYAHFFSYHQIHQLTERFKHHMKVQEAAQPTVETGPADIEELFGGQDDTLKFNF